MEIKSKILNGNPYIEFNYGENREDLICYFIFIEFPTRKEKLHINNTREAFYT